MKTKFTNIACGLTTASIFALALTACDESSPSAATAGDTNSSAIESTDASSSSKGEPASSETSAKSSETGKVSSSSEGTTITCNALSTECGYTEEELCARGVPGYCGNELVELSSSSEAGPASSSAIKQCEAFMPECGYTEEELCGMGYTEYCGSSSSTFEKCIDMDQMCPPCVKIDGEPACPLTNEACNACTTEGATAPNCKGGLGYVCSDGLWKQIKGEPICEHITDVDWMSSEGNCIGRTGEIVTDCATEQEFKCVDNYWVSLAPPPVTYINENATDVSAMNRGGPAVTPRIVKVQSASGSVTFRDDGVLVDDGCTFNGLNAELRGDTLFATILYPGCTTNGGHMGVITFSLGIDFADVKYLKYEDSKNVKPVFEVEELLPCGNTSSYNTCGGDTDDMRVGC